MLDLKFKFRPGHTSERSWMERSPLRMLFWNITYACNFRCAICFTDAGEPQLNELNTEEALQLVEKIHQSGIHDIIISGGEPFMRADIVEILKAMKKREIMVRIATNGSLVTPQILEILRKETLTKSFQVSLDSLDENIYAAVHGTSPDTMKKALENLDAMHELGFHTTISTRLTPETLPGIPELFEKAFQQGWPTVTVHCPLHTRRVKGAFSQDTDVLALLEPIFTYFAGMQENWLVETYIPWAEYHEVFSRLRKKVRIIHRGCRAGRDRLSINPTGNISPCVCMDVPEAHIGNVRTDNLKDVYQTAPLCEIMRQPSDYGICADCTLVNRCGGGCRASALVTSGRLDGDDLSCPVRQRKLSRNQSL